MHKSSKCGIIKYVTPCLYHTFWWNGWCDIIEVTVYMETKVEARYIYAHIIYYYMCRSIWKYSLSLCNELVLIKSWKNYANRRGLYRPLSKGTMEIPLTVVSLGVHTSDTYPTTDSTIGWEGSIPWTTVKITIVN